MNNTKKPYQLPLGIKQPVHAVHGKNMLSKFFRKPYSGKDVYSVIALDNYLPYLNYIFKGDLKKADLSLQFLSAFFGEIFVKNPDRQFKWMPRDGKAFIEVDHLHFFDPKTVIEKKFLDKQYSLVSLFENPKSEATSIRRFLNQYN